jgi:molybdenum cofactor biosynthesis protein B
MIVNIALLTVTDTRTFENDKSGAILVKKIEEAKHKLIDRKICKDNKEDIIKILKDWINQSEIDVVITTGGTGLTGRDITPEAVNEIADKLIPGKNSWYLCYSIQSLRGFS